MTRKIWNLLIFLLQIYFFANILWRQSFALNLTYFIHSHSILLLHLDKNSPSYLHNSFPFVRLPEYPNPPKIVETLRINNKITKIKVSRLVSAGKRADMTKPTVKI